MSEVDRRAMLRLLAAAPVAAGFAWTADEVAAAADLSQTARSAAARAPFTPKFFNAHEWETVRLLADLIIPRDERSGSASDAGVPEFIDFLMTDEPRLPQATSRQTAMRGGLAWLDAECQRRFDKTFVAATDAERTTLLDDISQPMPAFDAAEDDEPSGSDAVPAIPIVAHGRAFFRSFRDLTATGFWTTKMGMEDLRYSGNRFVADWQGCPEEALKRLGVSHPP
jgi:hypothetical protein